MSVWPMSNFPTKPTSLRMEQRSQKTFEHNTVEYTLSQSTNTVDINTSSLVDETIDASHASSAAISLFNNDLVNSATMQESKLSSSNDQLAHISQQVDQLSSDQNVVHIAVQEELERIRGEAARTRGEIEVIGRQAQDRAQLDKQRMNIERLPIVPGASYSEFQGCMENTRMIVIQEIVNFLTRDDVDKTRIFLLFGCAGSGKTAIAHSVASVCDHDHHSLGSSFFFQAGQILRDTPGQLVSSVVRGLSVRNTDFAGHLSDAIEADPNITHSSLTKQFQSLFLHPTCITSPKSQPIAIVIDAIDEGWSEELLYIIKACSGLPSWIRILITLRDDGFILPRLRSQTHIHCREIEINAKSNMRDIQLYIDKRLRTIACDRELHDWPTPEVVDCMCAKAKGLFVWAAVACNSIADMDLDPLEQYKELMSYGPLRDTRASVQMDVLYQKVLSKCRLDEPRALLRYQQSLGAVLALKRPLSIQGHNELLNESHTQHTLRPLIPVFLGLSNQRTHQPIQIIHQSFREFVTQTGLIASPSGSHVIVESEHNDSLALCCLSLINKEIPRLDPHTRWITDAERDTNSSVPVLPEGVVTEALWYACEYVVDHLQAITRHIAGLTKALTRFIADDVHGWLAICAMKGNCLRVEKLLGYLLDFSQVKNDIVNHPSLAQVLRELSESLFFDNRREEALVTANESVKLCRMIQSDAGDSMSSTAASLSSLYHPLSGLGFRENALVAIRESESIYRSLARDQPSIFNHALATSLITLSVGLARLGRHEEALARVREGVDLLHDLARDRPAAYNSYLAASLTSLSIRLAELGHYEEALIPAYQSVDRYRALAKDQPAVYYPELSNSLNSLSIQLAALGRHEEALESVHASVVLYRGLTSDHPSVYTPYLANSLNSFSIQLASLDRHEEALASAYECVDQYRGLAELRPAFYTPYLANSLISLSMRLSDVGRHEEALTCVRESVRLYRSLVRAYPVIYSPNLARSLNTLASELCATHQAENAIGAARESEELFCALAKELPLVYQTEWEYASELLQQLEGKSPLMPEISVRKSWVGRTLAKFRRRKDK